MSVNYNDGKFHDWGGGQCPVHAKTVVAAIWRFIADGVAAEESSLRGVVRKAGQFQEDNWSHTSAGGTSDIIAFCVIKEYREPREWWVTICGGYQHAHATKAAAETYRSLNRDVEVVHVREVLE